MRHIHIGIDPDSGDKGHGFAAAEDRRLISLCRMPTIEIYKMIERNPDMRFTFHIEDVLKSNSIFAKKGVKNQKAGKEVARSVGMMQQSLTELLRALESLKHPYIEFKFYRISSQWKESDRGRYMMKNVWGYDKVKNNNEETRSAAYFLSQGCL